MVFLGLILAAAAVSAAVAIVMANDGPAALTAFGETVPLVNSQWQVFLAGAGVAVIFMLGMMLIFVGAGRRIRTRRDLRYLREEHEESLTTLEMEKRRLQRELARARKNGDTGPPAGGPPPGPPVAGRPVAGPAAGPAPGPRGAGGPMVGSASRSSFFDRTD